MSVSAFVFFLHPLDRVFYCGMALICGQNYFWLVMMVSGEELLAGYLHPFLHVSHPAARKLSHKFDAFESSKAKKQSEMESINTSV